MNDETKGAIAVLIIGLVAIVMTVFGRSQAFQDWNNNLSVSESESENVSIAEEPKKTETFLRLFFCCTKI